MSEAKEARVPSTMRISLSAVERAAAMVSAERVLENDELLRELDGRSYFEESSRREEVERLLDRLEQLPTRTKAGIKSQLTQAGLDESEQREEVPWLFNDEILPDKMKLKLDSGLWVAFESLACTTEFIHRVYDAEGSREELVSLQSDRFDLPRFAVEPWLTDKGKDINEELLRRLLLLPQRSQAGRKALLTRAGVEGDLSDIDDLRAQEYHAGSQLVYADSNIGG